MARASAFVYQSACAYRTVGNTLFSGQNLAVGSNRTLTVSDPEAVQVVRSENEEVLVAIDATTTVAPSILDTILNGSHRMSGFIEALRELQPRYLIVDDGASIMAATVGFGTSRLFYTNDDEGYILADRSDSCASLLSHNQADPEKLACHLLIESPSQLGQRSVWEGVHEVQSGTILCTGASAKSIQRFQVPSPRRPLRESASELYRCLAEEVMRSADSTTSVSTDLSGGFDSTAIFTILAENNVNVTPVTKVSSDRTNDDLKWAEMAIDNFGLRSGWVRWDTRNIPSLYSGMLDQLGNLDEPVRLARVAGQRHWLAESVQSLGSDVHFSGEGGDQVLQSLPAYLVDGARTSPVTTLRHARDFASQKLWKRDEARREIVQRWPHKRWLRAVADELMTATHQSRDQLLGWYPRPKLPPWATAACRETVRDQLYDLSITEPFSDLRGQHTIINGLVNGAHIGRAVEQVSGGLAYAFPYYSEAVANVCLSTKPEELTDPRAYKPLLAKAFADHGAEGQFARKSKGDMSVDVYSAAEDNKQSFKDLFEDSVLVELGLIDADAVRRALGNIGTVGVDIHDLEVTVGLEAWVRSRGGELSWNLR